MASSFREVKNKAHAFVKEYEDAYKENAEAQSFLNDFFDIFGINRRRVAAFEHKVVVDEKGAKRIDLFWPGVMLVEIKSTGQNLEKAYQQGVSYFKGIGDAELPRFVMVCDLDTFRLYDLDLSCDYCFKLSDLVDNLHLFDFMNAKSVQDITELELNEKAAELLGKLHDALENSGFIGHKLQVFMVRVLFCLFAEDTGVFNRHQFTRYLIDFTHDSGMDTEMYLEKLFQTLDEPDYARSKNLIPELMAFPYVNGHLFRERIDMPSFSSDMRDQLIECCLFNWKGISPAIFGSLFQSIMDNPTRRSLGAHYTSEENILKVISPLFLDAFRAELTEILKLKLASKRDNKLIALMEKIRGLKLLDPACGCGNFLIISYRELRRLELDILKAQKSDLSQSHIDIDIDPQITLNNFYGIEIDEWPARIAEVAMWLTQHQMNVEFAKTFGREPDLLPLKEHAKIYNENALEIEWDTIVKPVDLNYIIGNPPFVDRKERDDDQRFWHIKTIGHLKNAGILDFVANWFYKASIYSQNTNVECAFVSTNSIVMGEQVGALWKPLIDSGIVINFAHQTFKWRNDAKGNANVFCVIIGFSHLDKCKKLIFEYPSLNSKPQKKEVKYINPYLVSAPNVVVTSSNKTISDTGRLIEGITPLDNGLLSFDSEKKQQILSVEPALKPYIKKWVTGSDYINNRFQWCFWLAETPLSVIRNSRVLSDLIQKVKDFRLNSKSSQKFADTPHLFRETEFPKSFVIIPKTSSENRDYIPIGFLEDVIASSSVLVLPNASLYDFGILTSQIHMDWMRVVAGRLKSDYRYSAKLVFNNFVWPKLDGAQKLELERLAENVLDARSDQFKQDSNLSLADLYDRNLMPTNLRKAHRELDEFVDLLYSPQGFKDSTSRVNFLFELYSQSKH